jgi:predicted ribonuclease YlaK
VHLLLPIVVIDELDNLKQSRDKHVRWRSRQALRIIDDRLANPLAPAELQAEDYTPLDTGGIPRGQVTAEIVFDPPGHVRLPIADDEIVDCALRVQALAGRTVTVITYDTRMSTRARAGGLRAVKIAYDPAKDPRNREPPT